MRIPVSVEPVPFVMESPKGKTLMLGNAVAGEAKTNSATRAKIFRRVDDIANQLTGVSSQKVSSLDTKQTAESGVK